MADVIVVGGGVIGLSIAYELAGQGATVKVLEQGQFGQEASWAAAGILPPGNPKRARFPESRLRAESHVLWPKLTAELLEETGIDNGYLNCGGIEVRLRGDASDLVESAAAWRDEGVEVQELTTDDLFRHETALSRSIIAGFRVPEQCQVRTPWHLRALLAGTAARGVELLSETPVIRFDQEAERVVAVRTTQETHSAGQFVIASGAWSQQLLANAGFPVPIEPVRGQIVLLQAQPLPFQHVISSGLRYLVPRLDGRILVGSTEEWVGFDKRNTAGAVAGLIHFATELIPTLANAHLERSWAGLRPGSIDGLAIIGHVSGTKNLFVASGHFRSGLQLSPATAMLIRQLILGQEPSIPLHAFACDRHHTQTTAAS